MGISEALARDRARVVRLFELFGETDDRGVQSLLMEEALATAETYKASAAEVRYILRGTMPRASLKRRNLLASTLQPLQWVIRAGQMPQTMPLRAQRTDG